MISDKIIKKWNEEFKALTKAEQRVAIAKDVIAQIKKERYIPSCGDYVEMVNIPEDSDVSIQKHFNTVVCEVCAIGAMFMSNVKFNNKYTFDEVADLGGHDQAKVLEKFFSKKDIALMEYVFEEWDFSYWDEGTYGHGVYSDSKITQKERKRVERAKELFADYTPTARLLNLMNHIVKNKGEFVI